MIITCEQCSTRFTLDDAMIQPKGSKVRCSQCKHIFTAFPSGSDTEKDVEPLEMDFSEDPSIDFDEADGNDQEFDDADLEFDDLEFEDLPAFDDPDVPASDFDSPQEEEFDNGLELSSFEDEDMAFTDIDDALEMDIPDSASLTENEPSYTLQTMPDIGDGDLELADGELDLELAPLDMDIEEIETIEDALQNPGLNAQKTDNLKMDSQPLQSDSGLVLDDKPPSLGADAGMADIEFNAQDIDDGLELVFEDDPNADLVFEESADSDDATLNKLDDIEGTDDFEDLNGDLELEKEFDDASVSLEEDEFQPESPHDGDEASEFFMEDTEGDLEAPDTPAEKFEAYDAVLDDDPDSGEVIPDPELDDVDLPSPLGTDEAPVTTESQPEDEMTLAGPAIPESGKPKKKAGLGAPIKVLFLLFLLVIAAYAASIKMGANIPFLSDINIPYVTDALKPPAKPVQHLKPVPNEPSINGRFVANGTAGELFIVTGRIDNPAQIPYSHIKVKGTLLDNTKAKLATQIAYCGNIIPEGTLKKGNISDITKQLNNKNGLQNANVNVAPGKSVPFMLVFSNLPEKLANFTVEVTHFKAPPQDN